MKILMYRWKAYNQQDIIDNLRFRGHEVIEMRDELINYEEDPAFVKRFNSIINNGKPDIMFTVNYFPVISELCQANGIRYVSWCCDCPIGTMYHKSVHNPVNLIYVFDLFSKIEFEAMNVNVHYLPLCAPVDRLDKITQNCNPEFTSDISFIGSMYNKNSYDEVYEHLPDYLKGYFDATIKMQSNVYGEYMLDDILDAKTVAELNRYFILAKTEESFSDLSLIFATTVLGFKIAQVERRGIIGALSEKFNVDVYTDDDKIDFVRARNRGIADYWNEAPKIFHNSKINLNITLRTIRSGIPLRVWDIMGAGGFCMTNYQPELMMYFENGKDIVIYEDKADLINKVKYYLEHDDERMEIARNGYNKVKTLHQYANRLDDMQKLIPGI